MGEDATNLWSLRLNGILFAIGPHDQLLARARAMPAGSWTLTRYEDEAFAWGGA
jgi:hypothetical protein